MNEDLKSNEGNIHIDVSKPTAFLGRPMNSGKKFAMASFTVRATRLQQKRTSSSSSTSGNVTTTTTTTKTRTFPKLPDAYWNNLVNNLYADFKRVLDNTYNIELIPIKDVLRAPSYARLEPISDKVLPWKLKKVIWVQKTLSLQHFQPS